MPNQRHSDKEALNTWTYRHIKQAMKDEAKRTGKSVSDLAVDFYIEGLQKRGVKIKGGGRDDGKGL